MASLAAAVLVIGLALGWPLLWAAISVDGGDAFDAVSRTYSYVFDSVLRFVGYVALAALVGLAGFVGVSVFAAVTLHLALWTVSWGAGADWLNSVGDEPFGLRAITFWSNCVWLVANAYVPSYVLTAGTAVYLLLRFRVDQPDGRAHGQPATGVAQCGDDFRDGGHRQPAECALPRFLAVDEVGAVRGGQQGFGRVAHAHQQPRHHVEARCVATAARSQPQASCSSGPAVLSIAICR